MVELIFDRVDYFRVSVTNLTKPKACHSVDVLLSLIVYQRAIFCANDVDEICLSFVGQTETMK